jgi:hypothetical protein
LISFDGLTETFMDGSGVRGVRRHGFTAKTLK